MSGDMEGHLTEAPRKGCWLWRAPPAGNPAFYPCLTSLDCKIDARLFSGIRALKKEGNRAGEEYLIGGKLQYSLSSFSGRSEIDQGTKFHSSGKF